METCGLRKSFVIALRDTVLKMKEVSIEEATEIAEKVYEYVDWSKEMREKKGFDGLINEYLGTQE